MKKFLFIILTTLTQTSQAQLTYTNPILAGFYPDPAICRAGDDYYIVNSSFAYYPGLPIFHSKDLANWKQIGHAMDRPSQLNLDGAGVSRGLFAPDIIYHNGTFYITCTLIDKGGNFIITAKDPKGPWSDPVWLPKVNGIDPSLFFDDSKAYVLYNSIPPGDKSLYSGHRTIRMYELDTAQLTTIGEEKILINGGTDITKKPVWIEGPHILKKDGWYYLVCAEGGTAYEHSEVVFRSKSVEGPYISYEKNPILTQRHLDPSRKDPVTTTGHAGLVETKDGKWYATFLGCRPYGNNYYNTGRETFMAPVSWKDGWPVILEGKEEVQYHYPVPMPKLTKKVSNPYSGNLLFRDEFNKPKMDFSWMFLRTPTEQWWSLTEKKGWLSMKLRPETCSGKKNPSFLMHRQQHQKCDVIVDLKFKAGSENEKAGMVIFQNESHYYFLCKSLEDGKPVIQLYQSAGDSALELLAAVPALKGIDRVRFRIEAQTDKYNFYYSPGLSSWIPVKLNVDGTFLSTKVAGGFVGAVFGLYATSSGIGSSNKVYFNWFQYEGKDDVYK